MIIRGEIILGLFIVVIILAFIVGFLIYWKKNKNNDEFFIVTLEQREREGIVKYLKIICK